MMHVAILLLLPSPLIFSNITQELAGMLAIWVCLRKRAHSVDSLEHKLWLQLAAAFLLWSVAEGIYCVDIIFFSANNAHSPSDFIWLAFAFFPLLLVISTTRRDLGRDVVAWMDIAQAASFFAILFALVFYAPASLSNEAAYNIQSVAIILTCALRYSATEAGPERAFFHNLFLYSILYGVFSAIGSAAPRYGQAPGMIVDICWSVPLLAFSTLVLASERIAPQPKREVRFTPQHMQGISALGLAVMSMMGAAFLTQHHRQAGSASLVLTFLLFAMRTTAREWQLRSAQQRLQHTALHDALTGFPNRAMLHQELSKRLTAGGPEGQQSAILFIDLDRFKTINDVLGHDFGDRLLITMAGRCRAAVRPQDIVARDGGDEFVILLDDVGPDTAATMASQVLEAVRQPLNMDGRVLHITASLGLVVAGAGADADEVLRDADCAMYKAKDLGKDRMEAFAPSTRVAANRKLRLETELRNALAANSIDVHYQPIYSLPGKTIVGFEALSRWKHPELGSILPEEFINVAEDMGLIVPLGKAVLKDACSRVQAWNRRFGSELTVNVNVSARQFEDPDLLPGIAATLAETGLPARLLKLEFTESALLAGHKKLERSLAGIRDMGVELCLDDFGTGYSSLSYLLEYRFDVIKIDKSFVKHLHYDRVRAELVETVIRMAGSLGMRVVAEGVECFEELERLRELQCHMVQGFYMSKPLSAEVSEALLERELGNWLPRYSRSSVPNLGVALDIAR